LDKNKKHYEEYYKRYRERQRDSGLKVVTRDMRPLSKVYLVPLSDFHIGCNTIGIDAIKGYLDWVKSRDNAVVVLNGDLMNCAGKDTSPELYEDLTTPDEAYEQLKILLTPIKDKIVMITRGGHEEAIFRKVGTDYMAHLCHDLRPDNIPDLVHKHDIPYRPNGGAFALWLSKNSHTFVFWGYATHGWGGSRTIGAKVKKAQDLSWVANVDIYILSHDHTQNINRSNVLEPPRSRVSPNRPIYMRRGRKLFANTGGFIDYSGYIQRKGYTPQDLGTPRIRLEVKQTSKGNIGYHKDIHASV